MLIMMDILIRASSLRYFHEKKAIRKTIENHKNKKNRKFGQNC